MRHLRPPGRQAPADGRHSLRNACDINTIIGPTACQTFGRPRAGSLARSRPGGARRPEEGAVNSSENRPGTPRSASEQDSFSAFSYVGTDLGRPISLNWLL